MEFYTVNINGNEIQLADYPGDKGTIIAIHGLTGTHKNMHYYAEKFKGTYRFIAVDLRGRGNSAETDAEPSIFKHAEDIIRGDSRAENRESDSSRVFDGRIYRSDCCK